MKIYKIKASFELVKETEDINITQSDDIFKKILKDNFSPFQECFLVIFLDAKNDVIGFQELFKGGLISSTVDLSTLFKSVLLANAISFIVAHNHPSGSLVPSQSDEQITQKIKEGSSTVGLKLLDHIIFTDSKWYSFADSAIL